MSSSSHDALHNDDDPFQASNSSILTERDSSSLPPAPNDQAPCPLCPESKAELFQHCRKTHNGYPFLASDFPPNKLTVCDKCGSVLRLGDTARSIHQNKTCKGFTEAMKRRLAGIPVHDSRQRSTSTTPIRKTSSTPSITPSSPQKTLRRSSSMLPPPSPSPTPSRPTPNRPSPSLPRSRHPSLSPSPSPSITQQIQPPTTNPALEIDPSSLESLLSLPASIKHLHPSLSRPFIEKASSLASTFLESKSDQDLASILGLIKLGLTPAMRKGHVATKARLAAYPNVLAPEPRPPRTSSSSGDNLRRAKELIEAGFIGKAERALNDVARIAPMTAETIQSLESKHPTGSPNPFNLPLHHKTLHPKIPTVDDLRSALRTFSRDTSPGPSGWSVKLLTLAMSSDPFAEFIHFLTSHICAGDSIGQQVLCSARLTPLLKPDGGIRPIAVGEMFYRLITKAIFTANYEHDQLHPCQLGVGSKGGIETITRAVQYAFDKHADFNYTHVAVLDSKNAFNTTRRSNLFSSLKKYAPTLVRPASWAHNSPTPLFVHSEGATHTLWSADGVRQGDPLAALLFSISMRQTLEHLHARLGPNYLIFAYLDDIVILGPDGDFLQCVLDLFSTPECPISLNADKCRMHSLDDVRSSPTGLEILGTCIGSLEARTSFLQRKVEKMEKDLHCLDLLPKQHSLLVLRQSLQQKLRHLLRSLDSTDLSHLWKRLDASLWSAFDNIRGPTPAHDTARDRTIISLPPTMGGMGILSHDECSTPAYKAASNLANHALSRHAPSLEPDDIISQRAACNDVFTTKQTTLMASLQLHEKVCFLESTSTIGRKWLSAHPSTNRFTLTDSEVQSNLLFRTLLPAYSGPCRLCASSNVLGHDESCPGRPDLAHPRHNTIRDTMKGALDYVPGITARIEPYTTTAMQKKNDIRITSDSDSPAPLIEDYDIKVVALQAATHLGFITTHSPPTPLPDALDDMSYRTSHVLSYQAQRKTNALKPSRRYPEPLLAPMVPLVISTGGLMERQMEEKLKHWKTWGMPVGMYNWMMTAIGVGLAKARGRIMIAAPP